MPALDQCHSQIVHALEKAGWRVYPGPFVIPITGIRRLFVDIYARSNHTNGHPAIIAVEVKCFPEPNTELNELYTAIGQYLVYRALLRERGSEASLYLAVPVHAFEGIFQQLATQVIRESGIKIIVVDLESEVIRQWLE
jgi:hypothetical protein